MSDISSIFDLDEYKQYKATWEARQKVLKRRAAYHDGSIYDNASWRGVLSTIAPKLPKNIRAVFSPLAAAVDVDAGIIPAEWEFADDAPEEWKTAREIVFDWSEWDVQSPLFVHYGAMLGVTGLRISDIQDDEKVVISAADPRKFMTIGSSIYSREPKMALWIEQQLDSDGEEYEYAEVHTPTEIQTYKNGELYSYEGRDAVTKNNIGRVCIIESKHIENGKPLSEPTFQKALRMLDEANGLLSDIADNIKNETSNVQWILFGVDPTNLTHGDGNIWFAPLDARVEALVPNVDLKGMIEFVRDLKVDIKDALPEKDFDELRRKDQIATDTLSIQLTELVLKIKRTRPNYDRALVTALQIAGRAAETMKLDKISVLNDSALKLNPKRAIIPETQTDTIKRTGEKWRIVADVTDEPVPAEIVLSELGASDEQIKEFGSGKLAAINAMREDKIPEVTQ